MTRLLAPDLSTRGPKIDPRPTRVELVVNGLRGKYFFFQSFRVSLQMLRPHSLVYFFFCGVAAPPQWARASSSGLFDHKQRLTTLGSTPLDEWWARRRELYLTIHLTHKGQTSITPAGFEPTIPKSERQQTHALGQCFSTFVRPRPGKFFFHKTRAQSQQIYS